MLDYEGALRRLKPLNRRCRSASAKLGEALLDGSGNRERLSAIHDHLFYRLIGATEAVAAIYGEEPGDVCRDLDRA